MAYETISICISENQQKLGASIISCKILLSIGVTKTVHAKEKHRTADFDMAHYIVGITKS